MGTRIQKVLLVRQGWASHDDGARLGAQVLHPEGRHEETIDAAC